MTKLTLEEHLARPSLLSQFPLGWEYNEKDYEVLMAAAADARKRKREEIRRNIAVYVAGVLPRLLPPPGRRLLRFKVK